MSSTYGENLKLSIFGQSHGPAIGMTMDGIPAGLSVDMNELQKFMSRRAPGHDPHSTTRKEADAPEFLSGIQNGFTCGAPISAIIRNTNTRSSDYTQLKTCPRPGHADYTAQVKYNGYQDAAGGGHFSGRLTAPLCIAGGMCIQWLKKQGIEIGAHLIQIGKISDNPFNPMAPELQNIDSAFPTLSTESGVKMREAIAEAKQKGDSLGGIIECGITGLPTGLGDPMFGGMENRIASIIFGIPAIKGIEFGLGFQSAELYGSENNDPYTMHNGTVQTLSNNAGGILGGITNGMPLIFRAAVKPTPSIARSQKTVNLHTMEDVTLEVQGRHDPCIAPRAVPVIEAAAAIAVMDAMLNIRRM